MKVEIIYSLLGETIAKQLKRKKITFNREKVKLLQKMAFQAMALHFHKLITEKQKNDILSKIHSILENHLKELSGEFDFLKC